MNPLKRIGVFCGSSPGGDPAFTEAAKAVGTELARRGIGLVYGGGFVIDLMPNLFLNLSAQIDDNSETFLAGIRYVY